MTDEGKEREALLDALYGALGVTAALAQHTEARSLLRAHDAAVWEQAAKVCDGIAAKLADVLAQEYDSYNSASRDATVACAAALRARAPKGEKP